MPMDLPLPLAQPMMTQGSDRAEGLAALGIAARMPRLLGAARERDAASISLSLHTTMKLPSLLVTHVTSAAATLRSAADLQAVANVVPDPIISPSGTLQKTPPSLTGISEFSALKAQDDVGAAVRDPAASLRVPDLIVTNDSGGHVPKRSLHKQSESDDEDPRAATIKPKADPTDNLSLLDREAIYRRLAHAKAQLSKIPRDTLPAQNGAWPDAPADHSAMDEAETAKPLESAEPKDHRPSVIPTGQAVNAGFAGSPLRRNARGKLVMRPLPDRPGDKETHVAVEQDMPTSNLSPATATVPGQDQDSSRGFKPSDKIARAVKSLESATSVSSPGRGLNPKIDLWFDADDRNDADNRRWHAACVGADPVARAKVLQLDKPAQIRFARDWEASKLARGHGSGGRDGREITDG